MKQLFLAASLLALAACGDQAGKVDTSDTKEAAPAPELLLPLPEDTVADITASDLAVRIKTLADDTFEGRGPGTPTGEAAAEWIAAEMNRIGLEPGGENGSYLQEVKMVNQTIDPSNSYLSFTSEDGTEIPTKLKDNAVVWTKRQNATELSFDPSDVVFVGYGAVAPEYDWNDYDDQDFTGKTVIILVNDPGFATQDPDLFNGKAMTYYGRWTYKYEEAARQHAAAAIVVHETAPAAYGWDVVANSWSGAQSDLVRANGGEDRTTMEAWITRDKAEELFKAAGLDYETLKNAAKERGFKPVPLSGIKAQGEITQTIEPLSSHNVIGVLPGKTVPDEYVLYTAHWDHLGKKSGEKTGAPGEDFYQDQIFNGAVDNATGAAALLEIAESMAAEPTDRSVMFLSVTLEESGLLGSEYFAQHPTVPLNQIVAGINMDGSLPVGRTHDMVVVGYGASELEDMLTDYLATQDRVVKPDPRPEAGSFYRSDHISLAKRGVPMLYADGGEDKLDGGVAAGKAIAQAYNEQRYHKPMDEYSDDWDLAGNVEDVTALYEVGKSIADSDKWPTWYPGNEFEAVRKASLGEK
ncbi:MULTISPECIES: M28 family metallopeptidase [Hyphomonas]|uniref:Peptidase M28 n=1 Tax=Hyphomonas adhaerens TaxID=81029 RepID=A0A3B9H3Z4_9PROT|nr:MULTISPECIES: M28 family metallopeptidase [Hyphomonas]MBB38644.1 peptidase M28 [Hyphomonas sp.]HAE29368.1 peptidase M28 [Hyphomonas adhaerens]|tara:strand:+ start:2070 stop:3809 length:1740 start_codon:yes stop_codon:yes gene_type:complete